MPTIPFSYLFSLQISYFLLWDAVILITVLFMQLVVSV